MITDPGAPRPGVFTSVKPRVTTTTYVGTVTISDTITTGWWPWQSVFGEGRGEGSGAGRGDEEALEGSALQVGVGYFETSPRPDGAWEYGIMLHEDDRGRGVDVLGLDEDDGSSSSSSIVILRPCHLVYQTARRSILLAPPANAFSGLWSSVRRRHGFLAVVALTSILSKFLIVLLSNVPYRVTQTF
ncbi:hypothetical protein F4809DRAFT_641773 [Biscogniauxia mediterranea]|nr:hypothetical protein F4809DRAFT_641773 [Biscogniauxia mediterranea]